MKKIVGGKLYDTDEAKVVCSWIETTSLFGVELEVRFMLCREKVAGKPTPEGLKLAPWGGVSDWDVRMEDGKGDFFLATEIGGICGKGRIRPVGVDEARRIFEERVDSDYRLEDDYERFFGVRPEKSLLAQLKEAFRAGAEAQKRYEKEAEKDSENEPF